MRILFMGTPDFAVSSLEKLYKDGHTICGVVAQPDKPKGRGMKMVNVPTKECALGLNIPVYQPTKIKNDALMPLLEECNPELIVVVAYGRILPDYIINYPKYGTINLHGSLLPEYRGAAPIQRSVLDGKETVGVSTMYMASELDAGDVIERFETKLGEYETSGELFDRLKLSGAELLSHTVSLIENGKAVAEKQDPQKATFAPMLTKEEAKIDWSESSDKIINKIRGYDPWPVAYSSLGDISVKLFRAVRDEESFGGNADCGTIAGIKKGVGVRVLCGDGKCVIIREIQASGSKRMSCDDYFRGHPDKLSDKFE